MAKTSPYQQPMAPWDSLTNLGKTTTLPGLDFSLFYFEAGEPGQPPLVMLGAEVLPDKRVRCWVRDNGAGIPPEKIDRLFAQFSRLEHMRLEGHGLGLSIVQRIMDRLGGEVEVKNVDGQGSEFSFILPGVE